jgi:hypothetical protein
MVTALLMFFAAACPPVHAQTLPPDVVSASLQLVRDTVYEHECFDMILAIEIRDAQAGRGMELAGMPESRFLQFGQFKELPIQRFARAGRQVEIRSYKCEVRAMSAGVVPLSLSLRIGIVRTQNSALGTMRFETPVVATIAPRTIRIVPLPPPPSLSAFSGAVGQFQFSATTAPTNLVAGELVRIVSRIAGKGWTDNIMPPRVSPGGAFRVYEPKPIPVTPGEIPELQFEQTLVPQTTNATDIPALNFMYFDPSAGAYRTAAAGPFRLQFQTRRPVVVEDTFNPSVGPSGSMELPRPRSPLAGMQASTQWTMLTLAIVYWFAVAIAMAVLAARLRRGVIGALVLLTAAFLVFAGGAAAARQHFLVRPTSVANRQEDARMSPGPDASISFTIPKDTSVTRLDEFGDWVKIDNAGNRGWIPASALSSPR